MASRRKIFTEAEFRNFAGELNNAIRSRNLRITAAAEVLGVTRQSVYFYLSGSGHQPRWQVIERACRTWDISFVAQGKKFDKTAFGTEQQPANRPTAVQLLLLPEAIERLHDSNLDIKIVRKEPGRICLELNVKFNS